MNDLKSSLKYSKYIIIFMFFILICVFLTSMALAVSIISDSLKTEVYQPSSNEQSLESASELQCGSTIYTDTVLTKNIGGCGDFGLIMGANNITLDCGGYQFGYVSSGVYLNNKSGVTIKNCNFYEGVGKGIHLESSSDNKIFNNWGSQTGNVIYLSNSNHNDIYNNRLVENPGGNEIALDSSNYNNIFYNSIWTFGGEGIQLTNSSNNDIYANSINVEDIPGFGVELYSSDHNKIRENNFNTYYYSVFMENSQYNIVWNNSFLVFWYGSVNALAFEDLNSNNNLWNYNGAGNSWSDFNTNPGYPFEYIIPGDGDGVDYYPLFGTIEKCSDSDGGFKPFLQGSTCVGNKCSIDFCTDNLLHEFACVNNLEQVTEYQCRGSCSLGACIPSTPTCTGDACSIFALD